jgi:uroporphyrinogen decarboxylase
LTHKEILLAGIALKPTPRLPVVNLSSGVWTCYQNGLTLQDTLDEKPEKIAAVVINHNTEVGSDLIWMGADCSNIAIRALGGQCTFNMMGCPAKVDEPLITKPADVERLRIEDLENSPELDNLLETARLVTQRVGDEFLIGVSQWGPFTLAGQLMGMEKLMVTALKDRAGVEQVLEFTGRLLLKYWNLFIDAGVELVNQAEPMSSGDVISKRVFREVAMPGIKAANQAISGRARARMLHICGNTTRLLDEIPRIETDLYSFDYKVDLKTAKEKLGGQIAFGGNLDPAGLLLEGTPAEIEVATQKCVEDAWTNGYILMPGCDIAPKTQMENVQAMFSVAKRICFGCR